MSETITRTKGKSSLYATCLNRAELFGILVSDEISDGYRTQIYKMPDGKNHLFYSLAKEALP